MSRINFVPNVFLESQELTKFQKFIFENGYEQQIKNQTIQYGVVKNELLDPDFENFLIKDGGEIGGLKALEVGNGFIIAKENSTDEIKFVRNRLFNKFLIPSDGNWYWIKVSPLKRKIELGKVSIDEQGNLIGTGTKFLESLRGQPNFPSKIRFFKIEESDYLTFNPSSLNSNEYEVLEVVNDEEAIIQGSFSNETELYYEIIGTFTAGYIVPENDKGVFRYDDCLLEIIEETSIDGTPLKPTYESGEEFLICRFKYDEVNGLEIQDYRYEIYKSKSDYELEYISDTPLRNIGVVRSRFDNINTVRTHSLIEIEWGFFASSYTIDESERKISINGGSGGVFKTPNDFVSGDFDGWNLLVLGNTKTNYNDNFYSKIEKLFKVRNSTKNGTSIDLFIEQFSSIDFKPQEFSITKLYKNGERVSTETESYILKTESSLGADLYTTNVYEPATSYDSGTPVFYDGDLYVSLQDLNQGNTPSENEEFWELVWEQNKVELLVVPDCEEVIVYLTVGEDVVGLDNETLKKTVNFPTMLGRGVIPAVSINAEDGENKDDLIYNIKYQLKNHKVRNNKKILPPNVSGYTTELGDVLSYGTTSFVDKAFIRSIRSTNSYIDFKNRVDLGDLSGVEIIENLKTKAEEFLNLRIPIQVGINKRVIRITGSDELNADVSLKLLDESAIAGNKFKIIIEPQILSGREFVVKITDNSNNTLISLNYLNLLNTKQIINCERNTDSWFVYLEDNSFNGENQYKQNSFEMLEITDEGVITEESGENVLNISGLSNHIQLHNSSVSTISFSYIRSMNGRLPNELVINNLINSSSGIVWNYETSNLSDDVGYLSDVTGVGNNGGVILNDGIGVKFRLNNNSENSPKYMYEGTVEKLSSSTYPWTSSIEDGDFTEQTKTLIDTSIPAQTVSGKSYIMMIAKGTFYNDFNSAILNHKLILEVDGVDVDTSTMNIVLSGAVNDSKTVTLVCNHVFYKTNSSSISVKLKYEGELAGIKEYTDVKINAIMIPADSQILP